MDRCLNGRPSGAREQATILSRRTQRQGRRHRTPRTRSCPCRGFKVSEGGHRSRRSWPRGRITWCQGVDMVRSEEPPMRKKRCTVWRATGVVTALVTAAAIASVAPAQAQSTAQLSVCQRRLGRRHHHQPTRRDQLPPVGVGPLHVQSTAAASHWHLYRKLRGRNDGHLHRHTRLRVLRQLRPLAESRDYSHRLQLHGGGVLSR